MSREEPQWLQVVWAIVGILALPLIVVAAPLWLLYKLIHAYFASEYVRAARARSETERLNQQVSSLIVDLPTTDEFTQSVLAELLKSRHERDMALPLAPILSAMLHVADALYEAEELDNALLQSQPLPESLEGARYRDRLTAYIAKVGDEQTIPLMQAAVRESFAAIANALPPAALQPAEDLVHAVEAQAQTTSIRLLDLLTSVPAVVEEAVLPFYRPALVERQLFAEIRDRLDRNLCAVSGLPFGATNRESPDLVLPAKFKGDPQEVPQLYLSGTPFIELFEAQVPFIIPSNARLEHTVIIAGSGHGKTQTLEAFICDDLAQENPPGIVVIDSKGDMVRRLSSLSIFDPDHGRLKDRLIVIDPRDGPSLNLFDVKLERLRGTDLSQREQIINGVIGQMAYFFQSLLGAEISSTIGVALHPLAQLMVHIPKANLHTLIDAIDDPAQFNDVIETLPPATRRFLQKDYGQIIGKETKNAVKRRIYGIITQSPTFERMFNAPSNQLDLAQALNSGKIVLISTERNFLDAASPIFGRYFISQCISAALQRAAIPEHRRTPAYLYIDEAASYFDQKIDELLTTLRSYRLGAVLAFQYLAQASPDLQSSISANTSIKLIGGTTERDARALASDMRTTSDFILEQHKDPATPARFTRFAAYVRNYTPHAVSLSVPLGSVDKLARMDDAASARFREINRARYTQPDSDPLVPPPLVAAQPVNHSHDENTLTRPAEDY
jgi:hypothetical protein